MLWRRFTTGGGEYGAGHFGIGTDLSLPAIQIDILKHSSALSLLRTQGWLLSRFPFVGIAVASGSESGTHKFADVEQQILGSTLVQPLVKPD